MEPNLFVFTFKDKNGNFTEITAPSKTQARERAKDIIFGGGALRYVSHRPETPEERKARHDRSKRRDEEAAAKRATAPRIVGRRKAFGRNDRCPCGSGKKVKHCRCSG